MSWLLYNQRATAPGAPASGKAALFTDNSTFPRLKSQDPAGNINIYQPGLTNASVASVAAAYATDTYVAGSAITIPVAGDWRVGGQYECYFSMVKTAAGTATPVIIVRMGVLGTQAGDAAIATLTFPASTAAADQGMFMVSVTFRTVGAGTSAVLVAVAQCQHNVAAGLVNSASAAGVIAVSAGFNSTTQTIIGCSFNGGASFSGTCDLVQARYFQP